MMIPSTHRVANVSRSQRPISSRYIKLGLSKRLHVYCAVLFGLYFGVVL